MADISAGGAARTLEPFDDGSDARDAAARRFEDRAPERRRKIDALNHGAAVADTPERLAMRSDRLRRYRAGEVLRSVPNAEPAPPARSDGRETIALPDPMLERVINNPDFVDIRFLEAGVAAARAVGRVNIRNASGRVVGYGTASMVSNRLALTNHHVLPTTDVAQFSTIEFNYQDGVDGQPLQPRMFRLDPDRFYLADRDFDFAIVAVVADDGEWADFGFNRLIVAQGKSVVGEFVTIVQHPKGEKKQVSLRENRVVDVLDSFLHYETDTEPGSSGSPVFNDQWEVVALHHASVPAPDHAELGLIMNEGIRVSALLRAACAASQSLPAEMKDLFDGLVQDERTAVGMRSPTPAPAPAPTPARPARPGLQSVTVVDVPRGEASSSSPGQYQFTVPVEITVRVGTPPPATLAPAPVPVPVTVPDNVLPLDEAIRLDPDRRRSGGR
ncbi:MAG: endonuclease mitochondrial [Actinomycetota bacterium]|jgi:endonuclease G|nr:endonuclease mitochondrial [Actinomycetota bacterium]